MLEKEAVKYTRDGMIKKNLVSGASEQLTAGGEQQVHYGHTARRYEKQVERYAGKGEGPERSDLPDSGQAQLQARLLQRREAVYKRAPAARYGSPNQTDVHMDISADRNPESAAFRTTSGHVHMDMPASAAEGRAQRLFPAAKRSRLRAGGLRFGAMLPTSASGGENDPAEEGARQVLLEQPRKLLHTLNSARKRSKEKADIQMTVQRQKQMQQAVMAQQAQQAAAQAGAKMASTSATAVTAASGGTAPVIVIIVVLGLALFIAMICIVGLISLNQADDDLAAYIQELDSVFLAETAEAGKKDGFEHRVDGAQLVHTDAGAFQILLNIRGHSGGLTEQIKEEIKRLHALLNTYSVAEGIIQVIPPATPENPDPQPEDRPAVIVTIQTGSLIDHIDELGLTAEERDAFENMWRISGEMAGSADRAASFNSER